MIASREGHTVISYAANINALEYLKFLLHFKVPSKESTAARSYYALGSSDRDFSRWINCEGHYDVTGLHSETMPTMYGDDRPVKLDNFDELVKRLRTYSDIRTSKPIKSPEKQIEPQKLDQCLISFCDTMVAMPMKEHTCSKILNISPLNELVEAYGERFFGAAVGLLMYHVLYMVGLSAYTLCTMSYYLPYEPDINVVKSPV